MTNNLTAKSPHKATTHPISVRPTSSFPEPICGYDLRIYTPLDMATQNRTYSIFTTIDISRLSNTHSSTLYTFSHASMTTCVLDYYGYRYYSSDLGRWISRDPIGERGGLNVYVAIHNAHILWIDPFGLQVVVGTEKGAKFNEEASLGDCEGSVKIHGAVYERPVDISFDWIKDDTKWDDCCLCSVDLGWIQHVKDHGKWRFDNPNYDFPPGSPGFIPSNPGAPRQPHTPPSEWGRRGHPESPFYGGDMPLPSYNDIPDNTVGDSFITQLVCPSTGEVLFTFTWRFTGAEHTDGNKLIYTYTVN